MSESDTARTQPADHFTTRSGKTIALKPWTFDLLSEHAADVKRLVDAWSGMALDSPEVKLDAIKHALPALRASVQNPDTLTHVEGLAEMVDFVEAVWDFNEIGVGLGKSVKLQMKMQQGILTGSEGALNLAE